MVTIEVIVVHGELREMIHDVSGRRSVGLWGECCKSPGRSSRGSLHRPAFGRPGFFPPTCIPQPFELEYPLVTSNETTRTTSPGCLVYKPDNLTGHPATIVLVLVSAPIALMATFTASSIGSLKGTSIRSRPCS